MTTSERLIFVARRVKGSWTPEYRVHTDELDAVVATMTERARENKAGELGYEVLEVEVRRRFHVVPQVTAVDVTEEPA